MTSPNTSRRETEQAGGKLEGEMIVGEQFDFVTCGVLGLLANRSIKQIRTDLGSQREVSSLWQKPEEIVTRTLAVRKVTIEDLSARRVIEETGSEAARGTSKCLGCLIA